MSQGRDNAMDKHGQAISLICRKEQMLARLTATVRALGESVCSEGVVQFI